MKYVTKQVRLERVLSALSSELAEATDEEVLQAAADLRMNPAARGSAAFLGVKWFFVPYKPEKFGGSPSAAAAGARGRRRPPRIGPSKE